MDALKQSAPAIAILAFGVNVMFNGSNWQRDWKTRKFGWWVFGCGAVIVAIGLLALCSWSLWDLAAPLVVGLVVGLGWRFARKDP